MSQKKNQEAEQVLSRLLTGVEAKLARAVEEEKQKKLDTKLDEKVEMEVLARRCQGTILGTLG